MIWLRWVVRGPFLVHNTVLVPLFSMRSTWSKVFLQSHSLVFAEKLSVRPVTCADTSRSYVLNRGKHKNICCHRNRNENCFGFFTGMSTVDTWWQFPEMFSRFVVPLLSWTVLFRSRVSFWEWWECIRTLAFLHTYNLRIIISLR